MRAIAIFGALAAAALGGCGNLKRDSPPPEPLPVWKRYTTPDGRWSAEFPMEPHSTEGGLKAVGFGEAYLLLCTDIPQQWLLLNDDAVLDVMRGAWSRDEKGNPREVLAERRIVVDGCSGREGAYRDRDSSFRSTTRYKVLIRDGKLYHILAFAGFSETQDSAAKRFIDSFRFEKPKSE